MEQRIISFFSRNRWRFALLLALSFTIFITILAAAQSESVYSLPWWSIDAGGSVSQAGGQYVLSGSFGQPDAAVWSGEEYAVHGGFWRAAPVPNTFEAIFLPILLKNPEGW